MDVNQEVYDLSQAEIEGLVQQIQSGNHEVDGESDREYADVSASASWAHRGGNMKGWITYAGSKIHFEATRISRHVGFFWGGGGLPRMSALKPEVLAGKTGTFKIEREQRGQHRVLALQMWVDGVQVLGPSLILVGVGTADLLEGAVKFTLHR